MNPSYARIRLPITQALPRFSEWIGIPQLESPRKLNWTEIGNTACENGVWRCLVAVFIYESGEWTVFDDQTGYLASFSADRWQALASRDELVFAGYNDSVPYGQLLTAAQVSKLFAA